MQGAITDAWCCVRFLLADFGLIERIALIFRKARLVGYRGRRLHSRPHGRRSTTTRASRLAHLRTEYEWRDRVWGILLASIHPEPTTGRSADRSIPTRDGQPLCVSKKESVRCTAFEPDCSNPICTSSGEKNFGFRTHRETSNENDLLSEREHTRGYSITPPLREKNTHTPALVVPLDSSTQQTLYAKGDFGSSSSFRNEGPSTTQPAPPYQ